jgi:hypothetical protein
MHLSSSQRESVASNATGSSWAGTEADLTFSTTSSFYEKRGGTLTRLEVEVGILGGVDDSFLYDIEGRSSPHSQSFPSTPSDASFMSIPGRDSADAEEAITPIIHSSQPVLPDNHSSASKKSKKQKKQYQTVPIINGNNLFVGNRFVGFNKTSLSLFDELLAHEEIEGIVESTKSRKQKQKEVMSNAVAGMSLRSLHTILITTNADWFAVQPRTVCRLRPLSKLPCGVVSIPKRAAIWNSNRSFGRITLVRRWSSSCGTCGA